MRTAAIGRKEDEKGGDEEETLTSFQCSLKEAVLLRVFVDLKLLQGHFDNLDGGHVGVNEDSLAFVLLMERFSVNLDGSLKKKEQRVEQEGERDEKTMFTLMPSSPMVFLTT